MKYKILFRKKSFKDYFKLNYELIISINNKKKYILRIVNHHCTSRYPPNSFTITNLAGELLVFGNRIPSTAMRDDCEVKFLDSFEYSGLNVKHLNKERAQLEFDNIISIVDLRLKKFFSWGTPISFNSWEIDILPSILCTRAIVVSRNTEDKLLVPITIVFLMSLYAGSLHDVG